MRTVYWLLVLVVAMFGTAFVTQRAASASAAPVATTAVETSPVGTIKDVMKGIVDPNAMAVWDAVSSESGANGEVIEKAPKTDEEWAAIEHKALTLAEAANLLVTPGRPMSRPATSTLPDVATSSRSKSLRKVDLPEPDGPTKNTNSPLAISREVSRRATTSPL